MTGPEKTFSWWDREIDSAGRPIRADVRLAAHEIWEGACHRTQAVLADHTHAADLMESSVTQVSRYLDYRAVPLSSRKMNALLVLAFSRALYRRAAKLKRLETVGGSGELSIVAVDRTWIRQVDARLELEQVVRLLCERSRTILALRYAGYTWKESAKLLGTSVSALRSAFWREVDSVRAKLNASSVVPTKSTRIQGQQRKPKEYTS